LVNREREGRKPDDYRHGGLVRNRSRIDRREHRIEKICRIATGPIHVPVQCSPNDALGIRNCSGAEVIRDQPAVRTQVDVCGEGSEKQC